MQFRPEMTSVRESALVQIATVAESMPDSFKLCYGESDTPTPEFICRAAYDASRAGHTFYTGTAGYPELREAIAEKVFELHRVQYRSSEIMSAVGASMGIFLAVRACVGPGDNAVIITPAYSIFAQTVTISGGEPRLVALARDGKRFRLDVEEVRKTIDRNTRMLIVNSPSNPTGWVISDEDQVALYELAVRHDLMVLSDEVYDRIVFDRPIARSMASVAGDKERIIVVNSFSKTYNMTGWRLGWAQGNERVIGLMTKAAEFITCAPASMTQQAGIVALRQGDEYVREIRDQYAKRRALIVQELEKIPKVSLADPQGAFYAFFRIEGLIDSTSFAAKLVNDTGVAMAPGVAFGPSGEGYIRLCFAPTEASLIPAMRRFSEFMAKRD